MADVRTIADCALQRSVCNCNKDIIIIIFLLYKLDYYYYYYYYYNLRQTMTVG